MQTYLVQMTDDGRKWVTVATGQTEAQCQTLRQAVHARTDAEGARTIGRQLRIMKEIV